MSCYVEHELPAEFAKLPESQAAKARRVCAGCAYDLGRKHAADAEERLRERVRALTARVKELEASSR
jgi:hypothetical protein